jgi:hypothetical protein
MKNMAPEACIHKNLRSFYSLIGPNFKQYKTMGKVTVFKIWIFTSSGIWRQGKTFWRVLDFVISMILKVAIFWDVTPYNPAKPWRYFSSSLQPWGSIIQQNTNLIWKAGHTKVNKHDLPWFQVPRLASLGPATIGPPILSSPVNCCWSSPAQSFLVLGSVGAQDLNLCSFQDRLCVWKWSLLFNERRNGNPPSPIFSLATAQFSFCAESFSERSVWINFCGSASRLMEGLTMW